MNPVRWSLLAASAVLSGCLHTQLNGSVAGAQITISRLQSDVASELPASMNETDWALIAGEANWNDLDAFTRHAFAGISLVPGNLLTADWAMYVLTARQGEDLDPNHSMALVDAPQTVSGEWHALVKGDRFPEGNIIVSPVTEAIYRLAMQEVDVLSVEELLELLDQLAAQLVGDVNADGNTDYEDALRWNRSFHLASFRGDIHTLNDLADAITAGAEADVLTNISQRLLGQSSIDIAHSTPDYVACGKVSINGGISSSFAPVSRIDWDWGDGNSDTQWFPAEHEYANEGVYHVISTGVTLTGELGSAVTRVEITEGGDVRCMLGDAENSTPPPASPDPLARCPTPEEFSSITAFGESTSAGSGASPAAPAPYSEGRWSNGAVWVEQLGFQMGIDVTSSAKGGSNYARAGATSAAIAGQVADYLGDTGGSANGTGLYLVWGGGNDILQNETAFIAARNIADAIDELIDAGATHFLVPYFYSLDVAPGKLANDAKSTAFNELLEGELSLLESSGDITIYRLDTDALTRRIAASPATFGLGNGTDACYFNASFSNASPHTSCANPNEYFWWDGAHPSTSGHSIIAGEALQSILDCQ